MGVGVDGWDPDNPNTHFRKEEKEYFPKTNETEITDSS